MEVEPITYVMNCEKTSCVKFTPSYSPPNRERYYRNI